MPSGLVATVSQSKNASLFAPDPIDDGREDEKENLSNDFSRCVSVAGSQKSHIGGVQGSSPPLPQLPPQKQCPQTPVNRIPLAELIGNTEDAFNCDPKDTTPEDHIYWQHGPTPRSSAPSAVDNSVRRGKKRARSSSPAGSSQNQKSAHVDAPDYLELKSPQESLKIPHDPALDLWARYTNASPTKKDAMGRRCRHFLI